MKTKTKISKHTERLSRKLVLAAEPAQPELGLLAQRYVRLSRQLKRLNEQHTALRDTLREAVPKGDTIAQLGRLRFKLHKGYVGETPIAYVRKAYYTLEVAQL